MKRTRQNRSTGNILLSAIKIVLIACISTALLVLILALTMKWEWIGMERVDTINTCIKAISACFAGFMTSKIRIQRNWLLAGILGMLYMVVSIAIFAILNGNFHLGVSNISDLLMAFACASCTCVAVGIISEQFFQKGAGKKA